MTRLDGLGPAAKAVSQKILEGQAPLTRAAAQELVEAVATDRGVDPAAAVHGGVFDDLYEATKANSTFAGRLTLIELRNALQLTRTTAQMTDRWLSAVGQPDSLLRQVMDLVSGVQAPAAAPYAVPFGTADANAVLARGRESGLRGQVLQIAQGIPGSHVRVSGRFHFHPEVEKELAALLQQPGADDPDMGALTSKIAALFNVDAADMAKLDAAFITSLKGHDDVAASFVGRDAERRQKDLLGKG